MICDSRFAFEVRRSSTRIIPDSILFSVTAIVLIQQRHSFQLRYVASKLSLLILLLFDVEIR